MSEIIEITTGDKVRITLKPEKDGTYYYKKPLEGVVKLQRLDVNEGGEIETVLMLAFTEYAEENPDGLDLIKVKDIEKIELLRSAPESLIEIIQTTKDQETIERVLYLLRAYF
ncbi:hypothetical protein [Ruminococcus sp.]|uniref:hypothetical protein n=1 Tax=Ruminococcus sp. TaxID=41978 RepID=UPI0025DD5787|nr:hypothetical protein [Ruminococcus sp.]